MSLDWEIEELAGYAMNMSEEQVETMLNDGLTDELLYEKFEVDLEIFTKVIKAVLPFTPLIKTAITGKLCNGFVTENRFIVKQERITKKPID